MCAAGARGASAHVVLWAYFSQALSTLSPGVFPHLHGVVHPLPWGLYAFCVECLPSVDGS